MLCGVKQQAKYVGRQLCAANSTMLEQLIVGGATQLMERAIDLRSRVLHQIRESGRRISRLRLRTERLLLHLTQPFAPRIGEQSIERCAEMFHVKADRGGATGPQPYVLGRNV